MKDLLSPNMQKDNSPDAVCERYADQNVKVTSRLLNGMILLEGSREALEFLGHLLIAQANFDRDCGFHIAPRGAGNALFSEKSDVGLYIHRLPCADGELKLNAGE
jgi:hypothetical protein